MKRINIRECLSDLQQNGRTVFAEDNVLYCNWTCSGIRFSFTGTCLAVKIKAIASVENDRPYHPWMGVVMDDGENLATSIELRHKEGLYSVFQSEVPETHVITLVKLTENNKGKMGLMALFTDGCIQSAPPASPAIRLEFIGDSITCGFGNMVNDPTRAFYAQEENGWMSHAAIAARLLNAQYSIISCSGIAVTEGLIKKSWDLKPMPEYYPYQDRFFDEMAGAPEIVRHNFEQFHPNVIVLNLGTNDAAIIGLCRNEAEGIAKFVGEYKAFLSMIRSCNGTEPMIVCALGSLDYFLYDAIQQAVKEFTAEHHDNKVACFKYNKVRPDEGMGACGHPYITTQIRMGEELADYIRKIFLP